MTGTSVATGSIGSPWWHRPDPVPATPLPGALTADVAVVGGGLAGLAAAYYLRRLSPDSAVVVLEADRVGAGGSGCSTGIVAPGVGGPITSLRARYGTATAARMFRSSAAAVVRTIELVREEGLDCDLETNGQLVGALTRSQDAALRRQARAFAELGIDVPYLDRSELSGVLRTDAYLGALRHPLAATLDPVALCRALRARLRDLDVPVYEHTPVTRVVPGPRVALTTRGGTVTARQCVLATDAFTGRLGLLADTVVPLTAHVVRTAPLGPLELTALGWRHRDSVVDCRTFFDYYRLTPDDRLVLGGGRAGVPRPLSADRQGTERPGTAPDRSQAAAWRRLESRIARLFPVLDDVPVTDRWSGPIGAVVDRLPRVGAVPRLPGVWFTGGWCGHGIPLSVAAGADLARRMSDDAGDVGPLPWHRDTSPRLPGDPWRRWGLGAYLGSLDATDRLRASVDRHGRRHAA
ncbi:MAG: NAD(P)/FAD-dependent oxidoreductase [Actinomycetes bacterium]